MIIFLTEHKKVKRVSLFYFNYFFNVKTHLGHHTPHYVSNVLETFKITQILTFDILMDIY